ncbi:MAG TPA: MscL family protein, partial [Tissierellaceae bacterium]|nr:MscL family protein [Tissierellaceae bacterium]
DGTTYQTLAEAQEAGAITLNYGVFIGAVVDFIIIAFSIFFVIRQINKLRPEEVVEEEPTTQECPYCITEISVKASRCPNCTSSLEGKLAN